MSKWLRNVHLRNKPEQMQIFIKKCNVELNLSLSNLILPAWYEKYQAVITSLSWENDLIVIKLLITDSYKHIHYLYYMCMSQQLPYTHTNTHIHRAGGILCHLANSQQSLFLRWRLFHVIGPSVVMTLHLFSPSLCKLEKGNLVWHGA